MTPNEQLQLIAAWLSQYVTPSSGGILVPAEADFIRDGIRLLIDNGVMTPEEARKEALENFQVIIPWDLMD